jgi:hypothetical protein
MGLWVCSLPEERVICRNDWVGSLWAIACPRLLFWPSYKIDGLGFRSVDVLAMYLRCDNSVRHYLTRKGIESSISQYRNRVPTSICQLLQPNSSWALVFAYRPTYFCRFHPAIRLVDCGSLIRPASSTSPCVPVG